MQRVVQLLGGRVIAKYDAHDKKWLFTITSTGETWSYGPKTGEKIIEFLRALEASEQEVKGKVGPSAAGSETSEEVGHYGVGQTS
ncbi:hypothetical protein P8X24_11570 [Pyrococcus kukulkanii]|uniref:hypothetical protein n=1 Tax=Pyrococcus kukulkanii TaxID=1609559 RepID=UPI003569CCFA